MPGRNGQWYQHLLTYLFTMLCTCNCTCGFTNRVTLRVVEVELRNATTTKTTVEGWGDAVESVAHPTETAVHARCPLPLCRKECDTTLCTSRPRATRRPLPTWCWTPLLTRSSPSFCTAVHTTLSSRDTRESSTWSTCTSTLLTKG